MVVLVSSSHMHTHSLSLSLSLPLPLTQLSKPLLDLLLMCTAMVHGDWKRGGSLVVALSPLGLAGVVIGTTGVLLKWVEER